MATPLSRRLSTWLLATRWALLGRPTDARVLQEQMAALPPDQAPPPPDHEWHLSEAGWQGDGRWAWLVGYGDEPHRQSYVVARNTWHLARALTAEVHAALEPVFWAALRQASHAPKASEDAATVQMRREAELHNARSRMARAWLSVEPQQPTGPAWAEAWATFLTSRPPPAALAAGAMLAVLAEPPEGLDAALQAIPLDVLLYAAPPEWPWIPWLVLVNAHRRLDADLRKEGGPSRWPGVLGWNCPNSVKRSLERLSESHARALKARHAPQPTHPENARAIVFNGDASWVEGNFFAVGLAARFTITPALPTLLARAAPSDERDPQGLTALDRAVRDKTLGTAKALVEGGARFGLEMKKNVKQPWGRLFKEKPPASSGSDRAWRELEAALWQTRGLSTLKSWTRNQRYALMTDAVDHPYAAKTAMELINGFGPSLAPPCEHGWQLCRAQDAPTPLMRSPLTLVAHNPRWAPAEKEAFVGEVFRANDTRANTILDDFESESKKLDAEWATARYRSASALVWATVYAPGVLADLLKRSSAAEIDEALEGAGSWIGWNEGDQEGNASAIARGVTHSWHKHQALWMQATRSVDPAAALAALAAHPQTRADRDVRRPVPLHQETLDLSALEHAMVLTNGSYTALAMLRAGGGLTDTPHERALRTWSRAPRDMEALREGFGLLGGVDQPLGDRGSTLLMDALEDRDRALVALLLDMGADLDARRSDGATPRALAAAAGPEWSERLAAAAAQRLDGALPEAVARPPRGRL